LSGIPVQQVEGFVSKSMQNHAFRSHSSHRFERNQRNWTAIFYNCIREGLTTKKADGFEGLICHAVKQKRGSTFFNNQNSSKVTIHEPEHDFLAFPMPKVALDFVGLHKLERERLLFSRVSNLVRKEHFAFVLRLRQQQQ
jgi:hypothetical protein